VQSGRSPNRVSRLTHSPLWFQLTKIRLTTQSFSRSQTLGARNADTARRNRTASDAARRLPGMYRDRASWVCNDPARVLASITAAQRSIYVPHGPVSPGARVVTL
jgi:hypothetical protein